MKAKGKLPAGKKLWAALLIAVLVVCIAVVGLLRVLSQPEMLFEASVVDAQNAQETEGNFVETFPNAGSADRTVPTLPNMVNIMIMGIDAYENGATTSGTEPHADVCMVLAVNFTENKIDLVSLPRDLFTTTPGYYGYYKLNCVFNVGGGMKDPDAGFAQVCRTAERWMGGVSIPYYYAVDFQAVVDLVDAIGGIDFEVDTSYHTLSGLFYTPGMQHLDGDAVMGYLRTRTEADGLDSSRTERQRRMLMAIFQKLKAEGTFSQLLDASAGVYTNTSLTQTTALLNYAASIGPENITTRSMDAPISANYIWAFGFVDQQHRIDLIREIYGFNAPPVGMCTTEYESWVHDVGFGILKTLRRGADVLGEYEEQRDAGKVFYDGTEDLYNTCTAAYTALKDAYTQADEDMLAILGVMGYSPEAVNALRAERAPELERLRDEARTAIRALADSFSCSASRSWNVDWEAWPWDKDINQVTVDFN